MKGESVLLDHLHGRRVAARLKDGRLDDLLIDPPSDGQPLPGAIYRARVQRPMKGQGGVFVDLADGERGFLRDWKGLNQGDTLLVQITGNAERAKATPVTPRILFKSKWTIVTPGAPGMNISRQIRDEETRVALMTVLDGLDLTEGCGLIVRSAAATARPEDVLDDANEMVTLAAALLAENTGDPELLLDGPDAHHLAWREWGEPDDLDTAPGCLAERGALEEIDALRSPHCPLAGGASMIVEPTSALVAVDVNTGGDSSPAAGLKANIAALRDLPRQLRLRGLGGQIVIDLAPAPKKDRKQIEQVLRAALKTCQVETSFVGWTPLGHLELNRKRERRPLRELLPEPLA
jgi:Ribonuclease G/E